MDDLIDGIVVETTRRGDVLVLELAHGEAGERCRVDVRSAGDDIDFGDHFTFHVMAPMGLWTPAGELAWMRCEVPVVGFERVHAKP